MLTAPRSPGLLYRVIVIWPLFVVEVYWACAPADSNNQSSTARIRFARRGSGQSLVVRELFVFIFISPGVTMFPFSIWTAHFVSLANLSRVDARDLCQIRPQLREIIR